MGKDKKTKIQCRTCGGKGSVTKKVLYWNSKKKVTEERDNVELCTPCIGLGFLWV